MKVKTYSTLPEAHQDLERFYVQNTNSFTSIYSNFIAVAKNFQESLVHLPREEINPAIEGFSKALSELGKEEKVTMPLKLFNCSLGYGFEIHYLDDEADAMGGFFTSIDALVAATRTRMSKSRVQLFGADESPFFYTVTDPYHLSAEEKQKARKMYNFDTLEKALQSEMNTVLDAYVEYGLGPEECREFEREYLKFFN
jgi:hypothetical protein